jgi:hypothetical protein
MPYLQTKCWVAYPNDRRSFALAIDRYSLADRYDRTQPAPRKHPDENDRSHHRTVDLTTPTSWTGDGLTIEGVLGRSLFPG